MKIGKASEKAAGTVEERDPGCGKGIVLPGDPLLTWLVNSV